MNVGTNEFTSSGVGPSANTTILPEQELVVKNLSKEFIKSTNSLIGSSTDPFRLKSCPAKAACFLFENILFADIFFL
jgi:hypothetical protein